MYPRDYFDTFWRPTIRDEAFVAMSFDASLNAAWENILKPGITDAGLKPHRVDTSNISGSIITEIMEGIAHARIVIGDLTSLFVDEHAPAKRSPNANVMYEVGLAHALRQPCEVLLLRSDSAPILFDIGTIRIHRYDLALPKESRSQVSLLIHDCLREIDLHKGLKLELAIRSLDEGCLQIMHRFGKVQYFARPVVERDEERAAMEKLGCSEKRAELGAKIVYLAKGGLLFDEHPDSIRRMLDLEIIRCDVGDGGKRYAYHWTSFGDVVLKKLGYRR